MLITPSQSAHWYLCTESGAFRPCHEVPRKDGSGMRATTLADARKLGLLYSVTKVCDVVRRPALESWRIEQGILAALTLPRRDGETDDQFAHRVLADADQQSKTARDFGSLLHKQIELDLAGPLAKPDWTCEKHLNAVRVWLGQNVDEVHASEIIVGDPALGIAGKMDLDCTLATFGRAVIDFKCRRFKKGMPPLYADSDPLQLAAYRQCRQRELNTVLFELRPMALFSVIIDSDPEAEKPKVTSHWWSDEIDYMALFRGLLDFLKYQTGYDPAQVKAEVV